MGEVGQPWHVRDPAALRTLEAGLAREYPTLHIVANDDRVIVKGTFPIRDGDDAVDRYSVEIELTRDHPKSLPVVRETGGRIPWLLDRHVLDDGTACVVLPDAFWLANPSGEVSLLEYLRGPLHQYFLGQSHVEAGNPWPFGEWAHHGQGAFDHYAEVLKTKDLRGISALLAAALNPIRGHAPCPCGSTLTFRKCHRDVVNRIRKRVPLWLVDRAARYFAEWARNGANSPAAAHGARY